MSGDSPSPINQPEPPASAGGEGLEIPAEGGSPPPPPDGESTPPPAEPAPLPDLPAHHRRPTIEEYTSRGYAAEGYEDAMAKWEDELRRRMAAGWEYPAPPPEEKDIATEPEASEHPITEPSPPPAATEPPLPAGHVRVPNPADR